MPQSSSLRHQQSLDTLQGMVNAVLLETGNVLRSAYKKGPKTIGHTHDRLQESLPGVIDKFHLALDELEADIVRAKAVLGRDLRELQARRRKLEHPQVEQAEAEVITPDPAQTAQTPAPQAIEALVSQPTDGMAAVIESGDVDMKGSDIAALESKVDTHLAPFSPTSKTQVQVKPHDSEESMQIPAAMKFEGADTESKNTPGSENLKAAHGLGITTSGIDPSQDSEVPLVEELQQGDFDPLFETANTGDSGPNFDDFNFTGDNTNVQNEGLGEFDLSSFGDQPQNIDGDPGSLLQGLENFGNDGAGDDFNMLDLSNAAPNNQGTDENAGDEFGMSGGDLEFALNMGANDSAFDDLFDSTDFGDADNTAAGDMMDSVEFYSNQ